MKLEITKMRDEEHKKHNQRRRGRKTGNKSTANKREKNVTGKGNFEE